MSKKSLKKTFLTLFIILAVSFLGFSKKQTVESRWTALPLKIDGLQNDWSGNTFAFEKKVEVDYAFRNDADNFYVLFVFKDLKFLSSINFTGMTLWFNVEGKEKKNYGIKFISKRIPTDVFIALLEKQRGPIPEERKKQMKARPFYFIYNYEVVGKKSKSPSQPKPGRTEQPVFRAMKGKNASIYEFRVPLKKPDDQSPGIGIEPGKNVTVGFEWGGMTKELIEQLMKRRASGKVSDTDPSIRGDKWSTERDYVRGGDTRSPERMRIAGRYKKYSFWVDVKLAQEETK